MRLLGTQADICLAWLVNYLFTFAAQLPSERLPPPPTSSCDISAHSGKAERRTGDVEAYKGGVIG